MTVAALAALAVAAVTALPGITAAEGPLADTAGSSAGVRPTVSRVDVSHHPRVGMVVTPDGPVTRRSFEDRLRVDVNGRRVEATAAPLSPQDLQVVVVPDRDLPPAALPAQRRALTRLLLTLPVGAQTAVLQTDDPTVRPVLSADPAKAVRAVTLLRAAPGRTAGRTPDGPRLEAAMAAFSGGATVRRTLVLVTDGSAQERPEVLDHLRRRLAASGTTLFVLDTGSGPSAVTELAAATGGSTALVGPVGAAGPLGEDAAVLARRMIQGVDRQVRALARQFYVRFDDPAPLPHSITVTVPTAHSFIGAAGETSAELVVDLPVANPQAPEPWVAPARPSAAVPTPGSDPLAWSAALLVLSSLVYGLVMTAASRRSPRRTPDGPVPHDALLGSAGGPLQDLFFVFVLPCLNEEKVIGASLERLLAVPGDRHAVLVVDDGSDDGTAELVERLTGDRVWLLRRTPPHARQGKGEALNAAVRWLCEGDLLAGRDPDRVVLVVVDADGRLEPTALREVAPYFDDPAVGGVQIGVRINNRHVNQLARMQDMEFVIYTEVFQRGRRHLGSVGLGGNGQFMRLSALLDLGLAPWSRSLTEDLDLGVRLLALGWRNEFCHTAAVHQQGLVDVGRLVRQRTRWFQGHLQSWRLVPLVLRSVPDRARADLLYHLSSPLLLLIASLLTASFAVSSVGTAVAAATGHPALSWWFLSTYVLAVGPALVYGCVYRTREPGLGPLRLVVLAHQYTLYGLMWYVAGWWAVVRTARGRTGWAKTERTAESPAPGEPGGGVPSGSLAAAAQGR